MAITILPIDRDPATGLPQYTAQQYRQARAAEHGGGSGRQLGLRSGFRVGTPSNVLTATSTTWTLGPCAAKLDVGEGVTQGGYDWANDSNFTGSGAQGVQAADSTNPRKDIVYIQVNDANSDGSGQRSAPILYLAGTAGVNPQPPALPARSFLVGTISVPVAGGGSPTVALNPARYVAAGAPLPVATQAERDALTAFDGLTVQRMDLPNRPTETYDGTAWHPSRGTLILGHMGKTDGNQTISGTTAVAFSTAQILRGGVTFSDAQESLIVPKTGLYRVSMGARFTGTGAGVCVAEAWINANVPTGIQVRAYKDASGEPFPSTSSTIPLTAGDNIYMVAYGAAQYVYGAGGYNGAFLEIEYVGQ